jgi:hypothetical protein
MNASSNKWLKIWLVILSFWLAIVTLVLLLSLLFASSSRDSMWTTWVGDDLVINCAQGTEHIVTHLKDVSRHAYAELPKPLFVASSGGVMIPAVDLTKLVWFHPPDMYESAFPSGTNDVASFPKIGAEIEALYVAFTHAPLEKKK